MRALLLLIPVLVKTVLATEHKQCSGGDDCCSYSDPCLEGEGDCENDDHCATGLRCGDNNCDGDSFDGDDDCCEPSECNSRLMCCAL